MRKRAYEFRQVIGFEETNLVGNVYYANHIRWQGRCREMFLRDYAPSVLQELKKGLSLVTTRVACEYYAELFAFDEVVVRMSAGAVSQNRVSMLYDYYRSNGTQEELIAHGEQQIASMRHEDGRLVAIPLPRDLLSALAQFETEYSHTG